MTTFNTDYFGTTRPQSTGWDIGGHEYQVEGAPADPNAPATFTYDPSDEITGNDPVVNDADFSVRNLTVGAVPVSSIVEGATPFGTKYWRIQDNAVTGESGNRIYYFTGAPADSQDLEVLIIHRKSHSSYSQALPMIRMDSAGNVNGYAAGIVGHIDNNYRLRSWAESAQSTLDSGSEYSISELVGTWICTRNRASGQVIYSKSWEYGETEPEWLISFTDTQNRHTVGGSGFQLWLNAIDGDNPYVDIAWLSVGTEGYNAPLPTEITPARHVYYSVCPFGTGDLKVGSPLTVSIDNGLATFSVAQTGNIGQGCRVTYGTTLICYISEVVSSTQYYVTIKTGENPPNCTAETVNSIGHEFASLALSEAGWKDVDHLNTTDLSANDYYVYLPLYHDHDDQTKDTTAVDFDGFTAGAEDRIIIYAPAGDDQSIYSQRIPGYIPATPAHYQLYTSGAVTALEVSAPGVTIDGIEICVNNTTAGIRGINFQEISRFKIKNSLVWFAAASANQDAIRSELTTAVTCVCEIDTCMIFNAGKDGINMTVYSNASAHIGANLSSLAIHNCGNVSSGGGVRAFDADSATIEINAMNCIVTGCHQSFRQASGTNTTWDIHNCIGSDALIDSRDAAAYGCLINRTATDSSTPGAGDWVVFENITTLPYDLRLKSNAANDAQDMHADASGAGITIANRDIVYTPRPQGDMYCCGPFELWAAVNYIATLYPAKAQSYSAVLLLSITPPPVIPDTDPVPIEPPLYRGTRLYRDTDGTIKVEAPALDEMTLRTTPIHREKDLLLFCDHTVESGQREKAVAPENLFEMQPNSFLGRIAGFGGVEVLRAVNFLSSLVRAGFQSKENFAQTRTQTLTDQASVVWDISKGGVGVLTLGGNRNISFSNATAGHRYCLIIKQDSTGGRTLSFDAGFHFAGGTSPTATSTALAVTVLDFVAESDTVLQHLSTTLDSQ